MDESTERSGERAWEMLQLSVAKYRPLKAPEDQLVAAAPSTDQATVTRPDSVWHHNAPTVERRRTS